MSGLGILGESSSSFGMEGISDTNVGIVGISETTASILGISLRQGCTHLRQCDKDTCRLRWKMMYICTDLMYIDVTLTETGDTR